MDANDIKHSALTIAGRTLSYVDFGGPGRPLLALHGHMSDGMSYADLAARLAPDWRVIAPDQRGHGTSDRAADYSREGYLADLEALLNHLNLDQAVLLGHSLGAINAYQFAARHPDRVTALINAEGCAELGLDGSNPLAFVLNMPSGTAATKEAFVAQLGPFAAHFESAVRQRPDGTWGLHFQPRDMYDSEDQVHGNHWADWTATNCPALLVRGTNGGVLPAEQAQQMVDRRPGTRLVELKTDHFVYANDPTGFADAVRDFLATV
ncbi:MULTISPECIES: alpha/beta fold hydrolase [unclassified Streptomyces]|uniref:alpha/beta fold hydrolase n=1 Tax=unclassified Streptomyces TaxID=2593676 RepID=UPI0004CC5E60|nr:MULTISPECIES: alpha/beta hydrolase [unclassified Streptomyces]KOV88431.1 hydrolase [Streptomyces sp. NRRL WC-3723]